MVTAAADTSDAVAGASGPGAATTGAPEVVAKVSATAAAASARRFFRFRPGKSALTWVSSSVLLPRARRIGGARTRPPAQLLPAQRPASRSALS
ncbi:hypothetical protein GCM10010428_73940 [Actinosynnema pretiosum subsp. pretiosum]